MEAVPQNLIFVQAFEQYGVADLAYGVERRTYWTYGFQKEFSISVLNYISIGSTEQGIINSNLKIET